MIIFLLLDELIIILESKISSRKKKKNSLDYLSPRPGFFPELRYQAVHTVLL